uniref:Ycf37 n=1 Tax=Trichogloeopsis pedicellata TaxID=1495610 RepID=A0A1G4P0A3_9FLOR|nr:Hypothetical protein ycf37 [Trichogloeopsis pedicellata]SCW24338.1 Hypothetical protein ycf37 [Trichogloeopsis pedicellata]
MPTIYLISISCILSPITFALILQTINFYNTQQELILINKQKEHLSKLTVLESDIANQYFKNHYWYKAIVVLDNSLNKHYKSNSDNQAICYNMIGIILQKNHYLNIATEYYQAACTRNPDYIQAKKNLQNILVKDRIKSG